jgi:uncharacterized protein (DUF2252 family)
VPTARTSSKSQRIAAPAADPAPPRLLTPGERHDAGRARRNEHPREALSTPPLSRRSPMKWFADSNAGRVPELLPVRRERMLESPFAFFRGAAALMAHDLARLPHCGVPTQLCGDAHLSNFGFFASPERTLMFDLNDFDETAPGPFCWDLRRLAASFAIAARDRGFKRRHEREAVTMLVDAYRDRMQRFAEMDTLDAWYYRLTAQTLLDISGDDSDELAVIAKARRSSARTYAQEALEPPKAPGDHWNIRDDGEFVYHDSDATRRELAAFNAHRHAFLAQYRDSLAPERHVLLDRYALHDVAVLTPGVGSVGRRCFLLLLVSGAGHPLFLQCKEAAPSVLAMAQPGAMLAALDEAHDGQRIVQGQKLMQAASDIFLGWAAMPADPGNGGQPREFFVRQLRDMKASYKLEQFDTTDLVEYAEACGYGLARAHAKAGDAALIAGWMGKSNKLNRALVDFARVYADVNAADWELLKAG